MRKLMALALGAALFAAALGAGLLVAGTDAATASSTTTTTTTTDRGDDRGGDRPRRARAARREAGEDVRGPCDEAEHRNDPRCTGATGDRDDDNSGRNRRGSNRGRG
jgi:hypothetical protein